MRAATIILNGFAALWAALALGALHAPAWVLALPLLVSAAVGTLLWPTACTQVKEPGEGRRIGRLVGWASFTEGVAIFAGVNILAWVGRPDLTLCWIAAVVGVHFVPLARGIPYPTYNLTCVAMLGLAAAGLFLPPGVRDATVGGGVAVVLWATALSLLLPQDGRRPDAHPALG